MANASNLTDWDLMKQGQFELAYARITEEMSTDPEQVPRHFVNRGLCLLNLDRLDEALADFETVIGLRPQTDSCFIKAGVTLWAMGKFRMAIDYWRGGLDRDYTDAAGGVEVPALLYFAACRLNDPELEKQAVDLLSMKWDPSLAKKWPGPIAGFLLGHMGEETFLVRQTFRNPTLESRRLCRAHFWTGLSYFRRGNSEFYKEHLHQAVLTRMMIEAEYYLARFELGMPGR